MSIHGGGVVTSGTHSPSLDVGIGMGYVPRDAAAPGTELVVDVRGKPRRARSREEAHLPKKGVSGVMAAARAIPRISGTTPSTTGRGSTATRPTLGVTWFAQDSLGELVHFEAPQVGPTVEGRVVR